MSKSSERVKEWRRKTKARMVDAFGGRCCICSYSKCNSALEFHHLDPNEKDFSFGRARANIRAWDKLVLELKKCVLLCANCHREVHDQVTSVSKENQTINELVLDYKMLERESKRNKCPICGEMKSSRLITCSIVCAGKRRGKVDWNTWDSVLKKLVKSGASWVAISDEIGISDVGAKKRAKKLGLI